MDANVYNAGLLAINRLLRDIKEHNISPTPERFALHYGEAISAAADIPDGVRADERVKAASDMLQATIEGARVVSESARDAIGAIREHDIERLEEQGSKMEAMMKEMEELRRRVFTDDLTGANNRAWMSENIFPDGNAKEGGTAVFVDMNDFKEINDRHGHAAGDNALRYVATSLSKIEPKPDVVRFGGDEFILFYPDSVDFKTIQESLAKAKKAITEHPLVVRNTASQFTVDFSYGGSTFGAGEPFDAVSARADAVMYTNKKADKCDLIPPDRGVDPATAPSFKVK